MSLTTAGRNLLAAMIVGEVTTDLNNANAYIGVGDSATAFAQAQTDLQAVANKIRKGMESAYPTRTVNAMVFRAVFATTEANFTWNEWAVFNAAAAGTMFSRKVEALGLKEDTQSWQFTVTLTVIAA